MEISAIEEKEMEIELPFETATKGGRKVTLSEYLGGGQFLCEVYAKNGEGGYSCQVAGADLETLPQGYHYEE